MVNLQDYILNSQLFKTFRVNDLLFVQYQCLVDDDQADIWTHHNYLAYVVGGEKKWKTRQNEYRVGSGDALYVQRGAHTVYQYFTEQFMVLFIFLPDEFIQQVMAKYPNIARLNPTTDYAVDTVIPLSLNEVLEAYFNSLMAYFTQPKPPAKALLRLKMEELILSLLSQPGNAPFKQYLLMLGQSQKHNLENLMKANFTQPFSLEEFARLARRSLSSFQRDFKAVFQTTPGHWLTQERLKFSRFLLETTDKTVMEVMEESGFKNRSHFSRVFKQEFGVRARQFREKNEEEV